MTVEMTNKLNLCSHHTQDMFMGSVYVHRNTNLVIPYDAHRESVLWDMCQSRFGDFPMLVYDVTGMTLSETKLVTRCSYE